MFNNSMIGKLRVWCLIPACTLAMIVAIATENVSAQQDLNEGQRREVLQNLERGASALRLLGRHEEAEHLMEIARHLNPAPGNRDRARGRAQNREQDREQNREQNRERSAADRPATNRERGDRPQNDRAQDARLSIEHQLDVFRMAHHAFRESGRRDAIELTERVIHGLEMQQTGRRDDEAQQAIREMPNRGNQVELLVAASRFWEEHGHETKAGALASLAEQYQNRSNRSLNVKRLEPRDQPAAERQSRNRQQREPAGQDQQMDEIHQHLQRMSAQIEQLQRQINELRDRR